MSSFTEDGQPSDSWRIGFIADVERRTRRRFRPPPSSEKGVSASVQFKMQNGKAVELRFMKRSRDLAFNDAIKEAINATSYRPFPKELVLKAEFQRSYVKVEQVSEQ